MLGSDERKVVHQLQRALQCYDTASFVCDLDSHLEVLSWSDMIYEVQVFSDIHKVRSGAVRNWVMQALDLQGDDGLQGDLLMLFKDIRAYDAQSLRAWARSIAKDILQEQIRLGNTFFLDCDLLSHDPVRALLVPDILAVRERQLRVLERHPPISDGYSTYYRFQILTRGGFVCDAIGVSEQGCARRFTRDMTIQRRSRTRPAHDRSQHGSSNGQGSPRASLLVGRNASDVPH